MRAAFHQGVPTVAFQPNALHYGYKQSNYGTNTHDPWPLFLCTTVTVVIVNAGYIASALSLSETLSRDYA